MDPVKRSHRLALGPAQPLYQPDTLRELKRREPILQLGVRRSDRFSPDFNRASAAGIAGAWP